MGISTAKEVTAACASLSLAEAALYAVLATTQPRSLTAWAEAAFYAGLRPTPTTRHTTQTLRPVLDRLEALGLATQGQYALTCPPGVRPLAWRWCARLPTFATIARAAAGGYASEADTARAILYGEPSRADEAIDRLLKRPPEMLDEVALEATSPADEGWLDAFPEMARVALVERALVFVERASVTNLAAYDYVARNLRSDIAWTPTLLAAWAGIAIARGELDRCRELATSPAGASLKDALRVALAFVEGRAADVRDALQSLGPPRRGAHMGIVAALVVMAMRAEGAVVPAEPWLRLGAAKTAPFAASFSVLAELIGGKPTRRGRVTDVLHVLVEQLLVRAESSLAFGVHAPYEAQQLQAHATVSQGRGYRWLAEQLAFAACALWEKVPPRRRLLVTSPPVPPTAPLGPSILEARSARPAWELDLDRIEGALPDAAASLGSASARPAGTSERIAWRTLGLHCTIEPYLQKLGANGKWSGGRKLAIKHLAGGGSAPELPAEDAALRPFVREVRDGGYYPTSYHVLDLRAWVALVGHPRVYDETGERRLEVVRGEVRVVSKDVAGGVSLRVEPAVTTAGIHPQRLDDRVVVYEVTAAMRPVLAALARDVVVPPEGKPRLAGTLRRIAAVLPVETSEDVAARSVATDARIHARLIPSDGGLAMSLLVRPLGPGTAPLTPGQGAEKVLGRISGEVIQASRDLDAERSRAEAVVGACAGLDAHASGTFAYRVVDPEACLALVAALKELGEQVVVEWPQGAPIRIRARVGRGGLRGRLTTQERGFWLRGSVQVDGQLDIDLERMLDLLAANPGRYVAIAPGEYIELEQELRDVLAAITAARMDDGRGAGKASSEAGALLHRAAIGVLEALTDDGASIAADDGARQWRERLDDAFRRAPAVPRAFRGELRDYQLEGFRWMSRLAAAGLGACLADDMGLGKTVQIAALLLHRGATGPALVVAPTSVCEGWCRELARFTPSLRIRRAFGPSRADAMTDWKRRDVVVTSYALLHQDAAALQAAAWGTVVLDEAQLVKNAETLRAKAAMGLSAQARIVATGTPVENHAGDLYSLLSFLNPGLLGTQKAFMERTGKGEGLPRAIKRQIQPFILRRTKAEVLYDLPPITEIQRDVVLSAGEAKLYDSVRRAALEKLVEGGAKDRIRMFAELTRLRRLCCHPSLVAPEAGLGSAKLESFMELARELLGAGHRALVFSQFTDVLALVRVLLDEAGIRYQYLDGSTPTRQRTAAVDAFQAGEGDLFLISLKAGGFGLNLTAADYVIHLDPWWNPAVESQASDRAHRIGQTRPVTVYRLVSVGTIEERIVALHRDKRDLADAVLADTDKSGKLSAREMRALLEAE